MLVIERKQGERIFIEDQHGHQVEIVVTLLRTQGDSPRVKLGFIAPTAYVIRRAELPPTAFARRNAS